MALTMRLKIFKDSEETWKNINNVLYKSKIKLVIFLF